MNMVSLPFRLHLPPRIVLFDDQQEVRQGVMRPFVATVCRLFAKVWTAPAEKVSSTVPLTPETNHEPNLSQH